MNQPVKVFAPATVANVGPGFDVLGLCVDGLGDTMEGSLHDGPTSIGDIKGVDHSQIPADPAKNCAAIAATAYLDANGSKLGLHFNIDRQIPLSGGLGSSAAASVGGAFLAASCLGKPFNKQDIMKAALVGEAAVAGRHLDNIAACVLGGAIAVRDTESVDVVSLGCPSELLVTVITPDIKLDTKKSRAVLPTQLETKTWTAQMANCSAVVAAFLTKDWALLARAFTDHFAEPGRAQLIPGFGAAKSAAMAAGAIGCSISGGGPSIFALTADTQRAWECAKVMAAALPSPPRSSYVGVIATKGARTL